MRKILLALGILVSLSANESLFEKGEYKKAYPNFKQECNKDNSNACYRLGEMNEFGLGTGISYSYAYKYYKKSCDLNNKKACGSLGKMYYLGLGVNKDIKKANDLLDNACKNDIYEACDNYAYLQKKEYKEFKQDELFKACNGGIANSCIELANNLNPNQGIDFYLRACGLGDDYGCQMVSNWYLTTQVVNNKISNFSDLSDKECNNKNYKACKSIGDVYRYLNNIEKTQMYYEQGCELDDKDSCASLAVLQEHNNDFEKAIKNYEKSCKIGDGYSCSRLGYMYEDGLKDNDKTYIKTDSSKSKKFFQKACELGFTKACN
ncbi:MULTISPECIES: tetratricopeptide repeat protein [unclassified Campylobacter]|uniref:tetratricopeptide repeat protein n=1 Tax=unclassified Campylobacter TaxID=2593542 RepID=UPI001BDA2648|nr:MULTISPECIES: tetratricopeptide repeat protein [unclassified Campylobacter]MBZ7976534.1 sel1 repeat family protein [Campylobacter sp. RM12637]MBZ7980172.1 sel1 repeat family protein [Campylobacter sp. RM12642]MBZ7981893.1 sel1 repeat family protein [Campylobacter sp. RM12640]MBZ7982855.1 sel1 repeat family protein [Campylobacter sp. RM12647]MBZ7989200.1 sel1 repeat family protein [Campylobacter sp. RM12635]MBZ7991118.1 sel1 repeat family protein [Campylobacter sp. RM9331]MBZ8005611.1 sel1